MNRNALCSIHFNGRVRGKLTDVCNDASGIRNERPKFLAMKSQCIHAFIPVDCAAVVKRGMQPLFISLCKIKSSLPRPYDKRHIMMKSNHTKIVEL